MKSCRKCSAKVTVEDRHVTDLTLDEHGHVHEHVVQLLDGGLQLDEHLVPVLDVLQRLPQLGRVPLDLDVAREPRAAPALQTKQYRYPFCTSVEVTRNI